MEGSLRTLEGDDVGALVIDPGRTVLAAGFAGDEWPRYVAPAAVGFLDGGQPKFPLLGTAALRGVRVQPLFGSRGSVDGGHAGGISSAAAGHNASAPVPALVQSVPGQPPGGVDPAVSVSAQRPAPVTAISGDVFAAALQALGPLRFPLAGAPALVAEPSVRDVHFRHTCARALFEQFDVAAAFFAPKAVLACFSLGRSTGLVADVSGAGTTMTPVHEGYSLQRQAVELPVGGDLLDRALLARLAPQLRGGRFPAVFEAKCAAGCGAADGCDPSYAEFARWNDLRALKEQLIYAVESPPLPGGSWALPALARCHEEHFLPDGTALPRDPYLGGAVCEGLFAQWPEELGPRRRGLAQAVIAAALSADVDARRDLLGALVFVGGCTLAPGFAQRVAADLTAVQATVAGVAKHKVAAPGGLVEKRHASWVGGSIMASLASFQHMWVAKAEVAEEGVERIVAKRCIF